MRPIIYVDGASRLGFRIGGIGRFRVLVASEGVVPDVDALGNSPQCDLIAKMPAPDDSSSAMSIAPILLIQISRIVC